MTDAPPPGRPGFPWRKAFARSTAAVFVVGRSRRVRYANPAFERLTGKAPAAWRGMRVSRLRSASDLGRALAVPPEAWAGEHCSVRRPPAGEIAGPPWWDIRFAPLPGDKGVLAVVGFVTVADPDPPRELQHVPADLARVRAGLAARFGWHLWDAHTPAGQRLVSKARYAAGTDAPVWVTGGPGAGKHTLARTLHHTGARRERAFVRVDGASVQPYLVEAQLFGKGGVAAGKAAGTLYLADPAALPAELQHKLLAWAARPHGPRLVCGADRPAADLARTRGLLPAFDAEFSVLELDIPPLAARPDDVPHYARRWAARGGHPPPDPAAVDCLTAHDWPGNVRELFAALDAAAAVAGTGPGQKQHLPRFLQERHLLRAHADQPPGRTLQEVLDGVKERMIARAVADAGGPAGGGHTAAARRLGMSRGALLRQLQGPGGGPA